MSLHLHRSRNVEKALVNALTILTSRMEGVTSLSVSAVFLRNVSSRPPLLRIFMEKINIPRDNRMGKRHNGNVYSMQA